MKTLHILTLISIFLFGIEVTAQDNKEQLAKKFLSIDGNGDAVLSKDEMIAFYKDKTDDKGERIHGIVLFSKLDTNTDNKVTLEEFIEGNIPKEENTKVAVSSKKTNSKKVVPEKVVPKKVNSKKVSSKKVSSKKATSNKVEDKTLSAKQKKKEKFRRIDLDDDKEITLREMVYFHKGKKNKNGEEVESELMFYGLDKNNDNKVTLREFLKKVDWKQGRQRLKIIESRKN